MVGRSALVTFDACQIIDPSVASAYAEKLRQEKEEAECIRKVAQDAVDGEKNKTGCVVESNP